ncbi:MAG: hypothetical protein D4R70_03655 [Betaproteobacteria bacterium]|nr:MAG: hypothetical protein D4R70_03655 [Betaproteobacteria bacterium]
MAVQLEAGDGVRIETSGAYVGRFTLARERVAGTGTKGIEFVFETAEGQVARGLRLWLTKASGERIEFSHARLSALMTCLNLKQIDTTMDTIEAWDREQGGRVAMQAEVFPALMNQPIGVVLRREEREWEGQPQVSMDMVEFFDPADRCTAGEIISGNRAGRALERVLQNLRDRVAPPTLPNDNGFSSPPPARQATPAASYAPPAASAPPPSAASFEDGDIPF